MKMSKLRDYFCPFLSLPLSVTCQIKVPIKLISLVWCLKKVYALLTLHLQGGYCIFTAKQYLQYIICFPLRSEKFETIVHLRGKKYLQLRTENWQKVSAILKLNNQTAQYCSFLFLNCLYLTAFCPKL